MLNLHAAIINNNLNNTICEELSSEWTSRLLPETGNSIVAGYYNAGILTINMSDFNKDDFYTKTIKSNYSFYCEQLYLELKPIIQKCLRRMFQGFNSYLNSYEVVLFMEGADGDSFEPVKYTIKVI